MATGTLSVSNAGDTLLLPPGLNEQLHALGMNRIDASLPQLDTGSAVTSAGKKRNPGRAERQIKKANKQAAVQSAQARCDRLGLEALLEAYENSQALLVWQWYARELVFQKGLEYASTPMTRARRDATVLEIHGGLAFRQRCVEKYTAFSAVIAMLKLVITAPHNAWRTHARVLAVRAWVQSLPTALWRRTVPEEDWDFDCHFTPHASITPMSEVPCLPTPPFLSMARLEQIGQTGQPCAPDQALVECRQMMANVGLFSEMPDEISLPVLSGGPGAPPPISEQGAGRVPSPEPIPHGALAGSSGHSDHVNHAVTAHNPRPAERPLTPVNQDASSRSMSPYPENDEPQLTPARGQQSHGPCAQSYGRGRSPVRQPAMQRHPRSSQSPDRYRDRDGDERYGDRGGPQRSWQRRSRSPPAAYAYREGRNEIRGARSPMPRGYRPGSPGPVRADRRGDPRVPYARNHEHRRRESNWSRYRDGPSAAPSGRHGGHIRQARAPPGPSQLSSRDYRTMGPRTALAPSAVRPPSPAAHFPTPPKLCPPPLPSAVPSVPEAPIGPLDKGSPATPVKPVKSHIEAPGAPTTRISPSVPETPTGEVVNAPASRLGYGRKAPVYDPNNPDVYDEGDYDDDDELMDTGDNMAVDAPVPQAVPGSTVHVSGPGRTTGTPTPAVLPIPTMTPGQSTAPLQAHQHSVPTGVAAIKAQTNKGYTPVPRRQGAAGVSGAVYPGAPEPDWAAVHKALPTAGPTDAAVNAARRKRGNNGSEGRIVMVEEKGGKLTEDPWRPPKVPPKSKGHETINQQYEFRARDGCMIKIDGRDVQVMLERTAWFRSGHMNDIPQLWLAGWPVQAKLMSGEPSVCIFSTHLLGAWRTAKGAAKDAAKGRKDGGVKPTESPFLTWYEKYVSVRRKGKAYDPEEPYQYGHWLFPLHQNDNHWILVDVNWLQRDIAVYDSLPNVSWDKVVQDVQDIINTCNSVRSRALPGDQWSRWTGHLMPVERQNNHDDCGAWVLAHTLAIMRGYSVAGMTNDDMPGFREWLLHHLMALPKSESNSK